MKARDRQVGGNHYKKTKTQPWDIIDEYGLDFYEGNALKYLLRIKGNRVEDLQKAIHYIEKEIEIVEENSPTNVLARMGVPKSIDDATPEEWDAVSRDTDWGPEGPY